MIVRLKRWSDARYGGHLSTAWLSDLIKDGLLPAWERGQNDGLSPTYFGTCLHYRRALQLKRLHNAGITSRDALLLQLFLRGYGIGPELVGSALRRELIAAMRKLRPQLRSSHFYDLLHITPGRKQVVSRQLGVLDERAVGLDLSQPDEYYVDAARQMLSTSNLDGILSGFLIYDDVIRTFPDDIENALNASPKQLAHVQTAFTAINRHMFRPFFGNGVINSPEYVALLLAIFLRMAHAGFTFERLLAKVPAIKGFQRQARYFKSALGSEPDKQ